MMEDLKIPVEEDFRSRRGAGLLSPCGIDPRVPLGTAQGPWLMMEDLKTPVEEDFRSRRGAGLLSPCGIDPRGSTWH